MLRFEEATVGRYLEARNSIITIVNITNVKPVLHSLRDVVGCVVLVVLCLGWGFAIGACRLIG